MSIPEVTPTDLHKELESDSKPFLLDVREDEELAICKLDIDAHIPMNHIPNRLHELDKEADIVVVCRSGNRSGRVAQFLLGNGFKRVRNLASGMIGWAQTVDPSMTQY